MVRGRFDDPAAVCYTSDLPPQKSGRGRILVLGGDSHAPVELGPVRRCGEGGLVALVDVKQLLDAGVHYGHRASRWNPKMRPYIYGKRNLIHIIDLRETVRGLLRANRYLSQVVSRGQLVLFVGTKRQAKEIVEREACR